MGADGDRAEASPRSRALLRRDLILGAARRIVATEGLEALSLRRVATELDVTAPALYAHVDDKADLLRGVAELEFGRLLARLEAVAEPDPLDRVRAQARAYVEHALADPALFRVMFLFRPDWSPQEHVEELPLASKAFGVASAAVEAAMAAGRLAPRDPLLVSLAIWSAAHGVATVLAQDLALGDDYERTLVDTVVDGLLAGLAAPDLR